MALLADGRAFLAAHGPAGLLAGRGWRPLDLRWSGALPDDAIIFAATASPDGTRLAAIARPPFAESPSALVVVEPAAGRAEAVALPNESLGAPPAWLGRDQVAIVQRGRDARTLVAIIDLATEGVIDRIPFRALALGTSGDGHTAVVLGRRESAARGPHGRCAGTTSGTGRRAATSQPGDVVRGGVALDRDGRRLAAVVEDAAGISRIATFVRAGDAWEPGVRFAAPPGSFGGRIAWLP